MFASRHAIKVDNDLLLLMCLNITVSKAGDRVLMPAFKQIGGTAGVLFPSAFKQKNFLENILDFTFCQMRWLLCTSTQKGWDMYTDEQVEAMWKQSEGKKSFHLVLFDTAQRKEWEPQVFYAKSMREAKALAVEWSVRYCSPIMRVSSVTAVS